MLVRLIVDIEGGDGEVLAQAGTFFDYDEESEFQNVGGKMLYVDEDEFEIFKDEFEDEDEE